MSLRKQGTCEHCGKPLYGDDYGAAGHLCNDAKEILFGGSRKWGDAEKALAAAILEAERRGEERAWNAARNPNLITVTIIDGYEWITPTTLDDWRNSEEYKKGKAEVEG